MTSKQDKPTWPYSTLPDITNDSALLHAINSQIYTLKDEFLYKNHPPYTSDLKNPHNALKSIIGKRIYQEIYLRHISTESARQLLLVITPLNLLAGKWRAQYLLDDNPEHYSIGVADYYGDEEHRSVKAISKFEAFMKENGNFMNLAKNMANDIDLLVADIICLKPRTENDFDDPRITFSSGLDDAKLYTEEIIDAVMSKYSTTTPHLVEEEVNDYAFYQHFCKNAGINSIINSGKCLIKENTMMHHAFSAYLDWLAKHPLDDSYNSEEDRQIAYCIAAINAVDRGGRGQASRRFKINCQEEYIRRVVTYVHYLRNARSGSNKSLTLKLIRKGKTNKDIMIFPVLIMIKEDIFSNDANEFLEKTIVHLKGRKSNEEITKYAANIFSALTSWEYSSDDIDTHIEDYFYYRNQAWSHRNKIMEKLLPLNFEQLINFHHEVFPILQGEKKRLEMMRDAILHARNCAFR